MADASGTTTYTNDANGDVTQQQFVAGSGTGLANKTVNYSYYTTGVQAAVTYPTYGSHTSPAATYTYDALGNMASVTDWLGNEVTFTHDGDGNLTNQANVVGLTSPNGTSSTAFSYDNADENSQATSTLSCSGSSGTLTQSFSGSTGSRNADGQVTQDEESYTSPCSGTSYQRNYSYDQAGRVVYQGSTAQGTNPNNIAYDASGDPTTISSHDSSGNFDTYTQTFDNAGAVEGQTPVTGSGGSSSTYSDDTLGDLTTSVTGSTTTSYGYNQLGQMASTSASGSGYLYTGDGLEAGASTTVAGWGSPTAVDTSDLDMKVSCSSSSFCAAVDLEGKALTYNGSTWSSPTSRDTNGFSAISCVSSSFCIAVDGHGKAETYNGTSWSSAATIDGSRNLTNISCTSSSFCVAVDTSGKVDMYNGSSWTATTADSGHTLESVSCASSSFCVAVDNAGKAIIYNGSGWSSASSIDGTDQLNSVSCTSSSFCVAVDDYGKSLTYNGSGWSSMTIDGTDSILSVSCTSSTLCRGVSGSNAYTYNGSSWSSATDIDGTNVPTSISCSSSIFCMMVDFEGDANSYSSTTTTAQLTWDTNGSLPTVLSDSTNDYIYGPNHEPVEQVNLTSSTPTYLTYTSSDDSWLATNGAGAQVAFWRYDTFGNLTLGTPDSPFGYSGQYTDASTGLINDRARFYDSQTGGFTTRDPDFNSTDTAYTYAGDDPVNSTDPSGGRNQSSTEPIAPSPQLHGYWLTGSPNFVGLDLYDAPAEVDLSIASDADLGTIVTVGVCTGQPDSASVSGCKSATLPYVGSSHSFLLPSNVDGPFSGPHEEQWSYVVLVATGDSLAPAESLDPIELPEPEGESPPPPPGDDSNAPSDSSFSTGGCNSSTASLVNEEDPVPGAEDPSSGLLMSINWFGTENVGAPYTWGTRQSESSDTSGPAVILG